MSKPYCGIGDPPKGSRRGTAKECVDNKQVRYYGIKKINPKLLEKKEKTVSRTVLMKKHVKLTAKIKKFIEKIKKEDNQKKKDKMKTDAKKAHSELLEIDKQIKKLDKKKKKKNIKKEKK